MANDSSNYPGFELQQRLFSHYAAAMKQAGERINDAWGKIAKGQYGYGDLVADLGKGVAAQYQYLEELARLGARDDHRAAWARLSWPRGSVSVPSATVDLLRPIDGILEPHTTLTALGGAGGRQDLPLSWTAVADGNRLRVAVAEGTPRPAAPCSYIGFIATQEARHTPEVVVLLDVRD